MEVLTVDETAEILQISPFTVRELLRLGKLPGKKVGRQWRVRKRDLENYITANGNDAVRANSTSSITARDPYGTARLSEAVLARDWDTPAEDEAWAHLQRAR